MAFNITEFNNKWANFKEELARHINHALDKDGDTMNGSLLLSKNPTDSMEAATKEYVDYFWNFIPGNTTIKRGTHTPHVLTPINGAQLIFPYNLPLKNNKGEDTATTLICSQPQADGFVRFTGEATPLLISSLYYDGGSGYSYELTPERDFRMSYSVKYCREGYDDIVLYESPVFSAYEVIHDENHQLRQSTFEYTLPISRGVNGYVKYEAIIHSTTISNLNNWWHIYLYRPSFSFSISIGNPIFTL